MKTQVPILVLVMILGWLTKPALASYELSWNTVDGGGEGSSGGDYSLQGTVAQFDANSVSGGNYKLHGGFWRSNNAPTAADKTVTINENASYSFTVADFGFSDVDGDSLISIKITQLQTAGSLQLQSVDVSLNQVIPVAEISKLTFAPVANAHGVGYANFKFTVNDGMMDSSPPNMITVNVTAVYHPPVNYGPFNQSPINTIPTNQTIEKNTSLIFSKANGNQISVSDPDADNMPVKVSLTATNGSLSLNGIAKLNFSTGDGSDDTSMVFTGSMTDINTALNGMSFSPTIDYSGPASVQIVTNDQGYTGRGGALNDDDTVAITILPEQDIDDIPNVTEDDDPNNGENKLTCTPNSKKFDAEAKLVDGQACFSGKIKIGNKEQANKVELTNSQAKEISLSVTIIVDPKDVNKAADILIVAEHLSLINKPKYYNYSEKQSWKLWDEKLNSLKSAQTIQSLSSKVEVPILMDDFLKKAGEYRIWVGYRLKDDSITFNDIEPLQFFVGNSMIFTPSKGDLKEGTCEFQPLLMIQTGQINNNSSVMNTDNLKISSKVRVSCQYVGQAADIIFVANYVSDSNDLNIKYTHKGEIWQIWSGEINQLPTAITNSKLPKKLELPIYQGKLKDMAPGKMTVWVGYRLKNGTIIFNGLEPIEFNITD